MTKNDMNKKENLIQEINLLGPWVHGYFNLGNGIVIQDKDELQQKRLFSTRDAFFKILKNYYSKKELRKKTLCDIGCNTGYFLFELFNKFQVKHALGIEPRQKNLKKAKFIANFFNLPKNKYQLIKKDILSSSKIPSSDIVIVPGVMHHLDNHLKALEKIYDITNELCIIETMVLSDDLNSKEIANQLELKDILYQNKQFQNQFGIIGLKLESDTNDGSTIHSGIVGIPTTQALVLMMKHVGFDKVHVFYSEKQFTKNIFNKKSYRDFHLAIIIGIKKKKQKSDNFSSVINDEEENRFQTFIPFDIIKKLYDYVSVESPKFDLRGIPKLIFDSEVYYNTKKGEKASIKLKKLIGRKNYYNLIQSFKHAPYEKISFEYSKTCFHVKKLEESKKICENLIKTQNLDWRVVYLTYFLLAKIHFDLKNFKQSRKYDLLSLKSNPYFSLSKKLLVDIEKINLEK